MLPESLRKIIRAHRAAKQSRRFVIDAFRNPFEVEFFKRRYSEFYLVGVLRESTERHKALQEKGLSVKSIEAIDKREEGLIAGKKERKNISSWVTSQNLEECAQKADVFIKNIWDDNLTRPHLHLRLIKLLLLSEFPGCLPPSEDERNMQIAMTARQMSGCISRQVGASVVGKSGYVLGVGWNDPPECQIPCALRTGHELVESPSEAFSEYEKGSRFSEHIRETRNDHHPYCFKDEFPKVPGNSKDRVPHFTRSLHAEENAFLQVAKNGGVSLRGATLYTTASTCMLCAKKAYQLGVDRIVYVEEYPDIALDQNLRIGTHSMVVEPFEGVIGSAFFRLYEAFMPQKDLVQMYLDK